MLHGQKTTRRPLRDGSRMWLLQRKAEREQAEALTDVAEIVIQSMEAHSGCTFISHTISGVSGSSGTASSALGPQTRIKATPRQEKLWFQILVIFVPPSLSYLYVNYFKIEFSNAAQWGPLQEQNAFMSTFVLTCLTFGSLATFHPQPLQIQQRPIGSIRNPITPIRMK